MDGCLRNRFWKTTEVMWFCAVCEFWYHLDCCHRDSSKKAYDTLQDFAKMPLLKGGPSGLVGTGPLVYLAIAVMYEIWARGDVSRAVDWKGSIGRFMGVSFDGYVEDLFKAMGGLVYADVNCPACIPVE